MSTTKDVKHLGHIPSDWDVHFLDEITKKKIVYGIVQAGPPQEKGIPYIRSTDVGKSIYISALLNTTESIAKKYSRSEVTPGDIVFSLRGNVGETSIVPENLKVANLTQGTARISVKEIFSNCYVRYALSFGSISRHIQAVSKGSTFREITLEDLRKIKVPMPPSKEQFAIASHLDHWDRSIDLTERLITAKQERRTWLMQQLLTGKRRLPGFERSQELRKTPFGSLPTDWAYPRISEVAREVSERNNEETGRPVLSCTKHKGLVDSLTYFGKQIFSEDLSNYKVVRKNQFAYATNHIDEGSIGYQNAFEEALISPIYTVFQTDETIDDRFLFLVLKTETYRHIFASNTSASVDRRGSLRWSDFAKIHIPRPSIKEQQAIVKVIDTADRELDLFRAQLDALREQKKGLMQQLLTGKLRVTV